MCLYTGSFPGLVIDPRYVSFVFWAKCFSMGQIAISAFSSSCCFFVRSIVDFFRLTIRSFVSTSFDDCSNDFF